MTQLIIIKYGDTQRTTPIDCKISDFVIEARAVKEAQDIWYGLSADDQKKTLIIAGNKVTGEIFFNSEAERCAALQESEVAM